MRHPRLSKQEFCDILDKAHETYLRLDDTEQELFDAPSFIAGVYTANAVHKEHGCTQGDKEVEI